MLRREGILEYTTPHTKDRKGHGIPHADKSRGPWNIPHLMLRKEKVPGTVLYVPLYLLFKTKEGKCLRG
jgi:hypothetical protein